MYVLITVASYKGGVGKTMTAVHLAGYLSALNPRTVLLDGDPNRSATSWARRGSLPFQVLDERHSAKAARENEHLIVDTQARPTDEDLESLARACDLLILPVTPDRMALEAMLDTRDALAKLGASNHRVLLTIVPPIPSREGEAARLLLSEAGIALFAAQITRAACFQKAADQGVLVRHVDDARAGRGWAEYEAVGEELFTKEIAK